MDLLMWNLHISDRTKILPVIFELAEQARAAPRHPLRKMTRRSLRRDLDRFAEVYNAAWSENWGFSPYSKADLDAYAQEMQLVFDPHWFMVAETAEGETVGGRDHGPRHQPGAEADERPAAAARLVALPAPRRKIMDRVRVGFLGVKPEFQHTGVAAALYVEHFDMADRHAADVGRDGLDPRDQQEHEPGDGGDGRADRAALPGLRAPLDFHLGRPNRYRLRMRRSEYLKASPPMFQSRLLDRFTRVHPVVPVLIYAPVIARCSSLAVTRDGWWDTLALVCVGYCLWTLFEYWLHRVVFHFEPEEGSGAAALDDPRRPPRPPERPAAARDAAGRQHPARGDRGRHDLPRAGLGACAGRRARGFLAGYLIYDEIHYALHHHTPSSRLGKRLRELHMRHHFQDDDKGFGISAPVLGRRLPDLPERRSETG